MEAWKIFVILIFLESVVSYPVGTQLQNIPNVNTHYQDDYRLNDEKLNSAVEMRKHLSVIKIAINYNSSNNNDISITRSNLQKNPQISNSSITSTISDPLAQIINRTLSQLLETSNRQSILRGLSASNQPTTVCASKNSGESTSTTLPEATNHPSTINDITTTEANWATSSIPSNPTTIQPTIVLPTKNDEKTTHSHQDLTTTATTGDDVTTDETITTESTATESTATESTTTDSTSTESTSTESASTDSTSTESIRTESSTTDSTPTESIRTESTPTKSSTTDSTSTESSTTDSTPTKSTSSELSTTDSTPTKSTSTESSSTDSTPTKSTSRESTSTESTTTDSTSTESTSTESSTTDSTPTKSTSTESTTTDSTSTSYHSTSDLSTTEHQQTTTHLPTTNNNPTTPDLPATDEQTTTNMQTTKDDSTTTTAPISDSTITEPGSLIPSVNNISIIEIAINYIKSNNNSVIIDV